MLPLNYANICTALLLEILLMYGLCKHISIWLTTLKWDFILFVALLVRRSAKVN